MDGYFRSGDESDDATGGYCRWLERPQHEETRLASAGSFRKAGPSTTLAAPVGMTGPLGGLLTEINDHFKWAKRYLEIRTGDWPFDGGRRVKTAVG